MPPSLVYNSLLVRTMQSYNCVWRSHCFADQNFVLDRNVSLQQTILTSLVIPNDLIYKSYYIQVLKD
jgi:hypothetical protein